MLDLYLMQLFIIRWRVWLTDRLTADWLDHRAYYRGRFIDHTIDNPDQRIQQDIDIFTTGYGPTPNIAVLRHGDVLLFGAVNSVVSVISFAAILWNLSGPLTLLGFTLPKALFWIVFVYVLIATIVAFWIGRPLIRLSFRNELFNAAFRYALVRLRDAAEAVGFYRGERAERVQLSRQFNDTIANYRRYVARTIGFTGWNTTVGQVINPLPLIVQAPRLFANEITFGDVTQSAAAFGSIQEGLSFFRNAYDAFASYRASIIRLHGLVVANEKARHLPMLDAQPCTGDTIELNGVEVRTPAGDRLVDPLDLRLEPGDNLWSSPGGRVAGKPPCCAASPSCGRTARARCAGPMRRTKRCSCRSCRTCRWVICARSCRIPPNPAASPTPTCSARSPMWRLGHLDHPPQRGAGLGQGAVPRRAAAGRVRPYPAHQTEGGLPRRGHVGPRRRLGVPDVRDAANQVAQHHRRQRQPPPHRRAAPRAAPGASRRG